jgi:hypothetical protein
LQGKDHGEREVKEGAVSEQDNSDNIFFSENFKRSKLDIDKLCELAVDLNKQIAKFDIYQKYRGEK